MKGFSRTRSLCLKHLLSGASPWSVCLNWLAQALLLKAATNQLMGSHFQYPNRAAILGVPMGSHIWWGIGSGSEAVYLQVQTARVGFQLSSLPHFRLQRTQDNSRFQTHQLLFPNFVWFSWLLCWWFINHSLGWKPWNTRERKINNIVLTDHSTSFN